MKNNQSVKRSIWELTFVVEFPDRTKSRRPWAFTTQEIGPATRAGRTERRPLPQPIVSGHSQDLDTFHGTDLMPLPGLPLPPLPHSMGPVTAHVLSSPDSSILCYSSLLSLLQQLSLSCDSSYSMEPSQLALFLGEARYFNLPFMVSHTLAPSCSPPQIPLAAWYLICQPP